jgi:hypothetical protein
MGPRGKTEEMNKKLIAIIIIMPVVIFLDLNQLAGDRKYAWRGIAIVLGISAVMAVVITIFKKTN